MTTKARINKSKWRVAAIEALENTLERIGMELNNVPCTMYDEETAIVYPDGTRLKIGFNFFYNDKTMCMMISRDYNGIADRKANLNLAYNTLAATLVDEPVWIHASEPFIEMSDDIARILSKLKNCADMSQTDMIKAAINADRLYSGISANDVELNPAEFLYFENTDKNKYVPIVAEETIREYARRLLT